MGEADGGEGGGSVTHDEMAAVLRQAGWTVSAPPTLPVVGATYETTTGTRLTAPRKVVKAWVYSCGTARVLYQTRSVARDADPNRIIHVECSRGDWNDWVRRNKARVVEG